MTPSKAPLRFLGTWHLTQCVSSRPDLPHPVSGVTTFTQENDSVHYEAETKWSDGHASHATAALKLDGSWCAVSGSSIADSISFDARGDSSFSVQMRKNDQDVGTNQTTISATGRSMNITWTISAPDGSTITWKTTSERQ